MNLRLRRPGIFVATVFVLFVATIILYAVSVYLGAIFCRTDNEIKVEQEVTRPVTKELEARVKPFTGLRVVHFDLKGAPIPISYFRELLPLLAATGVTSLLVEYEDMFPYSNGVPARNAYGRDEIRALLSLAQEYHLDVIPLIQTFGHMEFVLKLKEYEHLRELPQFPQSICPSRNGSFDLIIRMLDDVMELHPNIKYLHIGCDEVYQLGECPVCQKVLSQKGWGVKDLFLHHVTSVTRYIKTKYPQVTPLMWDDGLRELTSEDMAKFDLRSLVKPVVWYYSPILVLPVGIWDTYGRVFGSVWVASCFKGATGPSQLLPNISYHMQNNFAWLNLIEEFSEFLKFEAIVMTGWQRYDHFAVLCELLPPSIPSLVNNLLLITGKINDTDLPVEVKQVLVCGINYAHTDRCAFPGVKLYKSVVNFWNVRQEVEKLFNQSFFKGWITSYNIEKKFISTYAASQVSVRASDVLSKVQAMEEMLRPALADIYDAYTVNEWLETHVKPVRKNMEQLNSTVHATLAQTHWPKRPLEF